MRAAAHALVAALLLVMPGQASGQEAEELFKQVFGQKAGQLPSELIVPLEVDGLSLGQATVFLDQEGEPNSVDAAQLLDSMKRLLTAELFEDLGALGQDGRISFAALAKLRIQPDFDQKRLVLNLDVPLASRGLQKIAIKRLEPVLTGYEQIEPASFSAYLNTRTSFIARHGRSSSGILEFDGAVTSPLGAIEYGGTLETWSGGRFRRGPVRLIRDFPNHLFRLQLGDLNPVGYGLANSFRMTGIALGTSFEMAPYQNFRPANSSEFFLERPSSVELQINGIPVSRKQLFAGRYALSDFNLSEGTNDLSLLIEDDLGRIERIEFNHFAMTRLLASGVNSWGLAIGKPGRGGGGRGAERGLRSNGHFYRGFSDKFTAGFFHSHEPGLTILGTDLSLAGGFGCINFQAASSFHGGAPGQAIRMGWLLRDNRNRDTANPTELRFGFRYRSGNFDGSIGGRRSYEISTRASKRLGNGGNISLLASYHVAKERRWSMGGRLSMPLAGKASLNFETRLVHKGRWGGMIGLSLSLRFGGPKAVGSARISGRSNGFREVSVRVGSADGHTYGNLRALGDRDGQSIDARFAHRADRFETNVQHTSHADGSSITRFSIATSVAFAGGKIAAGRAVSGSFAIVSTEGDLDGRIWVDRTRRSGEKRPMARGNILISDLDDYRSQALRIEAFTADPSLHLRKNGYLVKSGLRTGSLIRLAAEKTFYVRFQLMREGQTLALKTGQMRAEKDGQAITFFTNKQGIAVIELTLPGAIEGTIDGRPFLLQVPEPDQLQIDMGIIEIP